jgi:hypothetical protein
LPNLPRHDHRFRPRSVRDFGDSVKFPRESGNGINASLPGSNWM